MPVGFGGVKCALCFEFGLAVAFLPAALPTGPTIRFKLGAAVNAGPDASCSGESGPEEYAAAAMPESAVELEIRIEGASTARDAAAIGFPCPCGDAEPLAVPMGRWPGPKPIAVAAGWSA